MKKMVTVLTTVLLAVLMLMTGVGQATPFQGAIWDPASTEAANPASGPPGVPATATFTVDILNFSSLVFTTYDTWLSGGAGNPNGLVWLNDPSNIKNTFFTSPGLGTFFEFTGTASFPANAVITHDDGFWLNLGGTVFNFSTPVSPTVTTLNNLAGTYTFDLKYGAWNGFPEVLQVPNVSPVPEPSTLLFLGCGLIGLAGFARKKFRK